MIKRLSILGDSISTYKGFSNDKSVNSASFYIKNKLIVLQKMRPPSNRGQFPHALENLLHISSIYSRRFKVESHSAGIAV